MRLLVPRDRRVQDSDNSVVSRNLISRSCAIHHSQGCSVTNCCSLSGGGGIAGRGTVKCLARRLTRSDRLLFAHRSALLSSSFRLISAAFLLSVMDTSAKSNIGVNSRIRSALEVELLRFFYYPRGEGTPGTRER